MMVVMLVRVGDIPSRKVVADWDGALELIKLNTKLPNGNYRHTIETRKISEGVPEFEGMGLVSHDQSRKALKKNMLGIKGDFFIIGMERTAEGTEANPHVFDSLTDAQVTTLRKAFAREVFRNMR